MNDDVKPRGVGLSAELGAKPIAYAPCGDCATPATCDKAMQCLTHAERRERVACSACPDGYVWTRNGPTGKACPVCKGKAYIEGA